jgi:SWIM zinc finger
MHQATLGESDRRRPGPEEWTLEVAAMLESTTHVSGIGWRLTAPFGPYPVRTQARRYGRTLVYSELAAVRLGLDEAAQLHCERILVRTSNSLVERLARGESLPRYRRAVASAARLRGLFARFASVRVETRPTTDPELLHAVGEALDQGLHAAAEREEHRVAMMERILERAKDVQLEEKEGTWIANGRYRVRLDPMSCECPAWTARWSKTPIAGRRALRLPCKHLVALALRQGVSVPVDLTRLARKA